LPNSASVYCHAAVGVCFYRQRVQRVMPGSGGDVRDLTVTLTLQPGWRVSNLPTRSCPPSGKHRRRRSGSRTPRLCANRSQRALPLACWIDPTPCDYPARCRTPRFRRIHSARAAAGHRRTAGGNCGRVRRLAPRRGAAVRGCDGGWPFTRHGASAAFEAYGRPSHGDAPASRLPTDPTQGHASRKRDISTHRGFCARWHPEVNPRGRWGR
jgi:hypothetical protein